MNVLPEMVDGVDVVDKVDAEKDHLQRCVHFVHNVHSVHYLHKPNWPQLPNSGSTVRAYEGTRIARALAELEGTDLIADKHVSEAVQYRPLDREFFG